MQSTEGEGSQSHEDIWCVRMCMCVSEGKGGKSHNDLGGGPFRAFRKEFIMLDKVGDYVCVYLVSKANCLL